jgi:heat shock protein HspQ
VRLAKGGSSHFSCVAVGSTYIEAMTSPLPPSEQNALLRGAPIVAHARFTIGDVVRHRMFGFRGVVFDIDPVFANSDEWYESIPEGLRPDRDQPFYHLLAENGEASYVAYVSQQNLVADDSEEPVDHPAIQGLFTDFAAGRYRLRPSHRH